MNTAINHGRERAEAIDKDGLQYTPEQARQQDALRLQAIDKRRKHVRRDHLDKGGDEE